MAGQNIPGEMLASEFNAKYGIPREQYYLFPPEVIMEAFNRANERCINCKKNRRLNNLQVVHIKVPNPSDSRYKGGMKMSAFQKLSNATVLCTACLKLFLRDDPSTVAMVHVVQRSEEWNYIRTFKIME